MPNYQMVVLLPALKKDGLRTILRRSAEYILETGGIIKKMENLGSHPLPYRIRSHGKAFLDAHYFVFDLAMGLDHMKVIKDKFSRDLDVVRCTAFQDSMSYEKTKAGVPVIPECTLYLDMLPPPYRPKVIKMQQTVDTRTRRLSRKKFKFNTGIDYDPL